MNARATRTVALIVVVAAFAALAAFALLARAYQPGRPAVRVPNASIGLVTPRLAQPIAASTAAPQTSVLSETTDAPAPAPTATPSIPTPAPAPDAPVALAACELGLPVPTEQAGLANLIAIVPLFGPFSPEAFAMVPAFQPAFPLFGPLLIEGGNQLNGLPLDALVNLLRPLETSGFNALSPLYGPVRPQVLAGESQVASALAPGVAAFASLPGATCVPAALSLVLN